MAVISNQSSSARGHRVPRVYSAPWRKTSVFGPPVGGLSTRVRSAQRANGARAERTSVDNPPTGGPNARVFLPGVNTHAERVVSSRRTPLVTYYRYDHECGFGCDASSAATRFLLHGWLQKFVRSSAIFRGVCLQKRFVRNSRTKTSRTRAPLRKRFLRACFYKNAFS